jgi:hypothetical protein
VEVQVLSSALEEAPARGLSRFLDAVRRNPYPDGERTFVIDVRSLEC